MERSATLGRIGKWVSFLLASVLLLLSVGCGPPTVELEKARQAETEAKKRLKECEEELAEARKALQRAGSGTSATSEGDWKAARLAAQVFVEAVNSRSADAASAAGTKRFQEQNGGANAVNVFGNGRFRGESKGYKCSLLNRLEAVPGKEEFVGLGGLLYRDVPRQDSSYTMRIVKEGESWRVDSFTAVER
jgi:hypothetical protein